MISTHVVVNSRRYKVREGERGGKYVVVNGTKKYLKMSGGDLTQQNGITHKITVVENLDDSNPDKTLTGKTYYEKMVDEKGVRDMLLAFFPLYLKRSVGDDDKNRVMEMMIQEVSSDAKKSLMRTLESDMDFAGEADDVDAAISAMLSQLTMDAMQQPPTIQKVSVESTSRLLVIGDVHGDVGALMNTFTHWYLNGYMSADGHIQDDYLVISTGDLVDYIDNSIDVLYAMTRLRYLNPESVCLLRGNHEGEVAISGKNVLYAELEDKGYFPIMEEAFEKFNLPAAPQSIKEMLQRSGIVKNNRYLETYAKFSTMLQLIGPCMLLVQYEGDNDWFAFMHGMWPVAYHNKQYVIWNQSMFGLDPYPYPIKMSSANNCEPSFSTVIMWNDLSDSAVSKISQRGMSFALEVGTDLLHHIMKENRVKAFVRGHQDSCHIQKGMFERVEGVGSYKCNKGVATSGNIVSLGQMRSCASGAEYVDGWCTNDVFVRGLPSSSNDVADRVFTASMAHRRSGGQACQGAYVLITPETSKGGSAKPWGKRVRMSGKGNDIDTRPTMAPSPALCMIGTKGFQVEDKDGTRPTAYRAFGKKPA